MKIKHVYIQQQGGTFVAPCGFTCLRGFRFLGIPYSFFEEEDLPSLPLTPETLVHGWVRTVHRALTQIGVPIPEPLDYPEALRGDLATPVWQTTLAEVRAGVARETPTPVFVKPVAPKLFTGHTVTRFSELAETASLPRETPVWAADIVEHTSEFRCFVLENRLLGFRHYRGSPWALPNKDTLVRMIRDYAPRAPAAYGLDVGLVGGRTYLVEVNDAYSLGDYGFSAISYAEMLEARWLELARGAVVD